MTPLALSDVASLGTGATALLNSLKLTPPQRRPMLVREIVFSLSTQFSTPLLFGNTFNYDLGGLINVKLLAGRFNLTNGFVPVWNFAPPYDNFYNGENNAGIPNAATPSANQQTRLYSVYRWILPKPMYLAPGTGVSATVTRPTTYDSQLGNWITNANPNTVAVRVTMIGELLARSIKDGTPIDVPYVSAYVTPGGLAGGSSGVVGGMMSLETMLKNELSVPMTTQRFIGALLSAGHVSAPVRQFAFPGPAIAGALRVIITDSKGYDITQTTNTGAAWESVFNPQHPAWTFNRTLEPNEQYNVRYNVDPVSLFVVPMISMVGSRREIA